MKRIFEIEWPDDCGPLWMNRDNLILCLTTQTSVGVPITVRDVTNDGQCDPEPRKVNDTLDAPAVAWESFVEVLPRAEREIWARFCGYDGIYRWLHPTENRWVDEPEQIGMPLFKSYQEAKAAIAKSPEPPTWKEYVASLPAPPPRRFRLDDRTRAGDRPWPNNLVVRRRRACRSRRG